VILFLKKRLEQPDEFFIIAFNKKIVRSESCPGGSLIPGTGLAKKAKKLASLKLIITDSGEP